MPMSLPGRARAAVLATAFAASVALPVLTPSAAAGPQPTQPTASTSAERPVDPIAHDPTMVKEGDWYYVAITGDFPSGTYLPMKRSKDLVHWEELGPVFPTLPDWVLTALGASEQDAPRDAWAPDLNFVGGRWVLYYAVSRFGTNDSVIGMATTDSLDPASPDFGWRDEGLVLRSEPGVDDFNAIDPDFTTSADGRAWLSFGSFFSGLHLRAVDPATGKLSTTDTTVRPLAHRQVPPNALEGPSIVRHGDFYYLFTAFDFCCRGEESDYRAMVGRSRSITGPYVDRAGRPLLAGGGTEVLRSYNEFVGGGHGDVFSDDGRDWFVNHYYDATDDGAPRLSVRPITWTDGWPVLEDPVNPSRSIGHGDAYVQLVSRSGTGDVVVENAGCGYEGADVALWTDLGNECQQWQWNDRGVGTASLDNRFSNKVAEVAGCDDRDGGNIAQWGWLGFLPDNDCQRFTAAAAGDGWTTIRSVLIGGRVWTTAGCGAAPGTSVVLGAPADERCQHFRFAPVGRVLLGDPHTDDRTLDGCTASRPAGSVGFQPRRDVACQEWRFLPTSGAQYRVVNAGTGSSLVPQQCDGGGAPARLRTRPAQAASSDCLDWTLVPDTGGRWSMRNTASGVGLSAELLIP